MSATARIQARRRVVVRVGFVGIVLLSLSACIFDRSDYRGGGRLDKGATAVSASASASAEPTEEPTTEPTTQPPQQDAASIFDVRPDEGG